MFLFETMQTSRTLIQIVDGVTRHPDYRLAEPLNFTLTSGAPLAICGTNGSGKSLLVDILTGAHPLSLGAAHYDFGNPESNRVIDNVRLITFRDVYGGSEPAYYQQRWNQGDEQVFATVGEVLAKSHKAFSTGGNADAEDNGEYADLLREIGIAEHLDKPVNLLSSGELRRMQLARMLVSCPQVLIVDNPYIGLDKAARAMLTKVLARLAERLTLVLVVCRREDIPPFVHRMVYMHERRVSGIVPVERYEELEAACVKAATEIRLPESVEQAARQTAAEVVDFRHITIRYGERTILRDLDWIVRQGEHWALTGENGAGKSTLLSLVCADNPQAYACDIRLFGYRRGRGESIWDIKKHIGYVSPEIFSTYKKNLPALDIVASGLHDTIGLYKKPTDEERALCAEWLRAFAAGHLAEKNYLQLSNGEQRLILLIRAFVKNPDLLILDEPFHGLDSPSRQRARALIDRFMERSGKTLIMVTHYEEELPECIDHHLTLVKQH